MKIKRGQVSLEFLMTYGWAILVIIIVGAVAWQWGMFDNLGAPKPGTAGFWGIEPEDYKYQSNGNVDVSFMNKIGAIVDLNSIDIKVDDVSYHATPASVNITAGGRYLWNLPQATSGLPQKPAGSRYELFLIINYTDNRTGDSYRSSGKLWSSVEA